MIFKSLKSISCTIGLLALTSLVLSPPTAQAGENCPCLDTHHSPKTSHMINTSAITTQRVGTVSVYRGPSISYDYAAAERARQYAISTKRALTQRRAQARNRAAQTAQQAAQINRLEGKVDALSARSKPRKTLSSIYGYGRTYRGNNRFFGRNGFIGNSNFSGATVQLPGRSRARRGLRRGTVSVNRPSIKK